MTAQQAETIALSIESVAKASAMFYVAEMASLQHPGKVESAHLLMLDEMRARSRAILVELLSRI